MFSPEALVRAVYEAISLRDYDAGFALLSDDFEWREPESGLLGGTHRGLAEARAAIEAQLEVFDQFEVEPEAITVEGERVAVEVRQRVRGGASGAEVEVRIGHLWTVEGGKLIRLEVFPERAAALSAAGQQTQR
jgi:ketosteroid isomerase-like protein